MAQLRKLERRGTRSSLERAAIDPNNRMSSGSPRNNDNDDRFFGILRPADRTAFFLLGGCNAVFSEPTQQIYALNDTAAYIWCRLEEQAAPAKICEELAKFGIGPDLAARHVRTALRNWLKLGLLEFDDNVDNSALPVACSFVLSIAGFDCTICVSDERLGGLLAAFEHHLVPARETEHVIHAIELNGLVRVLHNNRSVICCDDIELVPTIKAYITDQILKSSPPNVVFHAACLISDGKSMLISGRPGAGKTTLTLRLTEGGFKYGGDDIVLIAPDGTATAIPFAPAVKSGAWEIVKQFRPDLDDATVHRRPDAKRVRYLRPAHVAPYAPHPIGWILFIRRASGPATLQPLEPVETMRRLMGGSYTPDEKLSLAACRAINRALAGAGSFELTYSNLAEANDIIARLCNG